MVTTYMTTRCHKPEDQNQHFLLREHLGCHSTHVLVYKPLILEVIRSFVVYYDYIRLICSTFKKIILRLLFMLKCHLFKCICFSGLYIDLYSSSSLTV
jgi:hypothetical protein